MMRPGGEAGKPLEPDKQVVRKHADAEVDGIGVALSAGHLVLSEAVLHFTACPR